MYATSKFLISIVNCHLIKNDLCKEIDNDKEFVKLATAGRYKNVNDIYIKHNFYQQG